ncbi:oligosaccharide flippase family protein [Escherichia coli]|uniref:oligosaccharide flippase family protein n=1 Tax=Escherichia coli TaxID=562 RepID=UPI00069C1A30|nr:oligosaccharide flippase family protein [Escherichia coli]
MKNIIKNGLSLSFIKAVTLLFPIAIVPILISKIGMDKYGEVVFITAIYSYFINVVSFGFEESATQVLAKNYFSGLSKNEYILSVIVLKGIIAVSIIFVICGLYFFGMGGDFFSLLFCITIVAEVFNPLWFYQGVERIHIISVSSIVSKSLYTILICLFVRCNNDYYLVPVFLGGANILSYVYPFVAMCNECKFRRNDLNYNNLKKVLLDSVSIFLTNFIPTLKDKIGAILIGLSFSMNIVAIYDIIIKILNLLFIPVNVINASFYPTLSRKREKKILMQLMYINLGYAIFAFVIVCNFFDYFSNIYFQSYSAYSDAVKIISVSVVFYSVSLMIGKNILLVTGFYHHVLLSIILSTGFYLMFVCFMYSLSSLSIYSLCFLTTASFLFEMLVRLIMLKKTKALFFFKY